MFSSRTKTQSLFATTILVCAAVLCCKAEAAPKNYGNRQGDTASANIATQIGKTARPVTCTTRAIGEFAWCMTCIQSGTSLSQAVERYRSLFQQKPAVASYGHSSPNRHRCSASLFPRRTFLGTPCAHSDIVHLDLDLGSIAWLMNEVARR
jgi:hypothetical protein